MTKIQASQLIDALIEIIMQKLAEGEKVQLVGFGTFQTRIREACQGRSPATGEKINIPKKIVPVI